MEQEKIGTIYMATNLINGKQNVGQTTRSLKKRIGEHKRGNNTSSLLHKAIKKYGIKNFKWVSFSCPEEELDWQETFLIKELNTLTPNGYNLETGGNKNKHLNEITKEQSKERMKKYYFEHPEAKEEQSKKLKGKFIGKDNHFFGKHHTEITRQKISKNLPNMSGENNPFYGKHHTEEARKKQGENHPNVSGKNNPNVKSVILISPEGKEYKLLSYKSFCEEHNLNRNYIRYVLQNKRKHYKGWTRKYLKEIK